MKSKSIIWNISLSLIVLLFGLSACSDKSKSPTDPLPTPTFNSPSNLTATVAGLSVDLVWTAPASGSSGTFQSYCIYRDGNFLTTRTTTSYSDTAVNQDTQYSYYVLARYRYNDRDYDSEPSNTVNVTITIPTLTFNPPQNLSATATTSNISLTWQAPASGSNGTFQNYRIYRNGNYLTMINNTSYTDYAVSQGTQYAYYVTARYRYNNTNHDSEPSNTVDISLNPFIFNPPTNLTYYWNGTRAVLEWQAPASGSSGILVAYRIYVKWETDNYWTSGDYTHYSTTHETGILQWTEHNWNAKVSAIYMTDGVTQHESESTNIITIIP